MSKTATREKLKKELEQIPEEMLGELYEYMQYLQFKKQLANSSADDTSLETAYASESVLGKDWNSSEEDQAWQDL